MYTAYWLNTPRKAVHGGPSLNYTSYSAVAIEQEGYIDAINTPEWNVNQICTLPSNIRVGSVIYSTQMALVATIPGAPRTSSLRFIDHEQTTCFAKHHKDGKPTDSH